MVWRVDAKTKEDPHTVNSERLMCSFRRNMLVALTRVLKERVGERGKILNIFQKQIP